MVDWANTAIALAGVCLAIIALFQTRRSNRRVSVASAVAPETRVRSVPPATGSPGPEDTVQLKTVGPWHPAGLRGKGRFTH